MVLHILCCSPTSQLVDSTQPRLSARGKHWQLCCEEHGTFNFILLINDNPLMRHGCPQDAVKGNSLLRQCSVQPMSKVTSIYTRNDALKGQIPQEALNTRSHVQICCHQWSASPQWSNHFSYQWQCCHHWQYCWQWNVSLSILCSHYTTIWWVTHVSSSFAYALASPLVKNFKHGLKTGDF